MALVDVFENIKAHIEATMGATGTNQIKHVDAFHDQFVREEQGDGYTFASPAVFISFESPTTMQSITKGIQQGDLAIDIYVTAMSALITSPNFWRLVDDVHFQLQGYASPVPTPETLGNQPGPMNREFFARQESHTQRLVWKLTYMAPFIDESGFEDKNKQTIDGNTLDLVIDKNLKINNLKLNIGRADEL